jgi:hypothetical protein
MCEMKSLADEHPSPMLHPSPNGRNLAPRSTMRVTPILALLGGILFGCSKSEPLPGIKDTAQAVQTETTGDAVNRVASDQELLRQTLILADHKGTLEAGLTEAAQDSLVGIKMREALILGSEAKQHATPPPKKPSRAKK